MADLAEPYDATRDWRRIDQPDLQGTSAAWPSLHDLGIVACVLCGDPIPEGQVTRVPIDSRWTRRPVCPICGEDLDG